MRIFDNKILYGSAGGNEEALQFLKIIFNNLSAETLKIPSFTKVFSKNLESFITKSSNLNRTLKTLVISDYFETVESENISFRSKHFSFTYFRKLEKIVFGKKINLKDMGIQTSSPAFQKFEVSDENPYIKVIDNKALVSKDEKLLHGYAVTENQTSVDLSSLTGCEKILGGIFSDYSYLTNVILPQNLKVLYPESFSYNRSLKEINLPQGLERIEEWAFVSTSLKKVYIPDTVTYIGDNSFDDTAYDEDSNTVFYTNIGNRENLKRLLRQSGYNGYNNNIIIIEQ